MFLRIYVLWRAISTVLHAFLRSVSAPYTVRRTTWLLYYYTVLHVARSAKENVSISHIPLNESASSTFCRFFFFFFFFSSRCVFSLTPVPPTITVHQWFWALVTFLVYWPNIPISTHHIGTTAANQQAKLLISTLRRVRTLYIRTLHASFSAPILRTPNARNTYTHVHLNGGQKPRHSYWNTHEGGEKKHKTPFDRKRSL